MDSVNLILETCYEVTFGQEAKQPKITSRFSAVQPLWFEVLSGGICQESEEQIPALATLLYVDWLPTG